MYYFELNRSNEKNVLSNPNPDTVHFVKHHYEGKQPLTLVETVYVFMDWQTNCLDLLHLFNLNPKFQSESVCVCCVICIEMNQDKTNQV